MRLPEHECTQAAPGEPTEMRITGRGPGIWIQQPWGGPESASPTGSSVVVQGEASPEVLLGSRSIQMHDLG